MSDSPFDSWDSGNKESAGVTDHGALEGLGDNDHSQYLLAADLLNKVYPVGAIYMSVVSTSPATLFGGTWSAFAAGRVLVGINTADASFDTVGETGGAKTHTLSVAEMPSHSHTGASHRHTISHTHTINNHQHSFVLSSQGDSAQPARPAGYPNGGNNVGTSYTSFNGPGGTNAASTSYSGYETPGTGGSAGSGSAHNNLQPYIVVYMWKRTG